MIQTLKTASGGEDMGYAPVGVDTFNIGVRDGFCLIQAYSTLPRSLYPGLLSFAASYSPLGLVVLTEDNGDRSSFAIYQQADRLDLFWAIDALNRLDPGWTVEGQIAYSPAAGSTLKTSTLREILKTCNRDNVDLDTVEQMHQLKLVS